jgi:hypothetical protein
MIEPNVGDVVIVSNGNVKQELTVKIYNKETKLFMVKEDTMIYKLEDIIEIKSKRTLIFTDNKPWVRVEDYVKKGGGW